MGLIAILNLSLQHELLSSGCHHLPPSASLMTVVEVQTVGFVMFCFDFHLAMLSLFG